MDRPKRWIVTGWLFAVAVLAAAPAGAAAAGTCAITVTPATVHVGETFVIEATGFEPNEMAIGFAGLDPNQSASLAIQFDENGSLTKSVVAKSFMIGTVSVDLLGTDCSAGATLRVLPAIGAPATDTLASVKSPSDPAIPLVPAVIWVSGLAGGWLASRRRRSSPAD